MKKRYAMNFGIAVLLTALLAACGVPTEMIAEEPQSSDADIPLEEIEEIELSTESGTTEGVGFCDNEFFPLRSDRTWYYEISGGGEVNPYSITFRDIKEDSFTAVQSFSGVTNEVGWTCRQDGILSNQFANMNLAGMGDIQFETLDVDGTLLPPDEAWEPGRAWEMAYTVRTVIQASGAEITADGNINLTHTISAIEPISVPAAAYPEAYRVDGTGKMVLSVMGVETETPLKFTDWYVRDVGLVKSASNEGELAYLMELIAFE